MLYLKWGATVWWHSQQNVAICFRIDFTYNICIILIYIYVCFPIKAINKQAKNLCIFICNIIILLLNLHLENIMMFCDLSASFFHKVIKRRLNLFCSLVFSFNIMYTSSAHLHEQKSENILLHSHFFVRLNLFIYYVIVTIR